MISIMEYKFKKIASSEIIKKDINGSLVTAIDGERSISLGYITEYGEFKTIVKIDITHTNWIDTIYFYSSNISDNCVNEVKQLFKTELSVYINSLSRNKIIEL